MDAFRFKEEGDGGDTGDATGRDGGRRWKGVRVGVVTGEGGGRWKTHGDSGRCGDTNKGKLLEGLPSSSDIGISILIFCFLIKFLDLSMGAVAVLTFCCWGAGGGGETGTATRL